MLKGSAKSFQGSDSAGLLFESHVSACKKLLLRMLALLLLTGFSVLVASKSILQLGLPRLHLLLLGESTV